MTKERFFEIAREEGCPEERIAPLWNVGPDDVKEAMKDDWILRTTMREYVRKIKARLSERGN